ncbi:hypothetical protein SNEBB_011469 [Seison nebaliae]|nr:hypothetical protein SNEBB_011469 [Seison nebaliae]
MISRFAIRSRFYSKFSPKIKPIISRSYKWYVFAGVVGTMSDNLSLQFNGVKDSSLLNSIEPKSREVKNGGRFLNDFDLTLFQYHSCPFCSKLRVFLDYYGFDYRIVEVNSITKGQIKWSKYKKVPILLMRNREDGKLYQLNDSTVVISILSSFLQSSMSLEKMINHYQPLIEKKKILYPNKYEIISDKLPSSSSLEKKWRIWADDHFIHTLSPNVYRSFTESLHSFDTFNVKGKWSDAFQTTEQFTIKYLGAVVMWIIGKRIHKKYITDETMSERDYLYNQLNHFLWARESGKLFLGGNRPNLADLALYGYMNSIEGCHAFNDCEKNVDGFKEWDIIGIRLTSRNRYPEMLSILKQCNFGFGIRILLLIVVDMVLLNQLNVEPVISKSSFDVIFVNQTNSPEHNIEPFGSILSSRHVLHRMAQLAWHQVVGKRQKETEKSWKKSQLVHQSTSRRIILRFLLSIYLLSISFFVLFFPYSLVIQCFTPFAFFHAIFFHILVISSYADNVDKSYMNELFSQSVTIEEKVQLTRSHIYLNILKKKSFNFRFIIVQLISWAIIERILRKLNISSKLLIVRHRFLLVLLFNMMTNCIGLIIPLIFSTCLPVYWNKTNLSSFIHIYPSIAFIVSILEMVWTVRPIMNFIVLETIRSINLISLWISSRIGRLNTFGTNVTLTIEWNRLLLPHLFRWFFFWRISFLTIGIWIRLGIYYGIYAIGYMQTNQYIQENDGKRTKRWQIIVSKLFHGEFNDNGIEHLSTASLFSYYNYGKNSSRMRDDINHYHYDYSSNIEDQMFTFVVPLVFGPFTNLLSRNLTNSTSTQLTRLMGIKHLFTFDSFRSLLRYYLNNSCGSLIQVVAVAIVLSQIAFLLSELVRMLFVFTTLRDRLQLWLAYMINPLLVSVDTLRFMSRRRMMEEYESEELIDEFGSDNEIFEFDANEYESDSDIDINRTQSNHNVIDTSDSEGSTFSSITMELSSSSSMNLSDWSSNSERESSNDENPTRRRRRRGRTNENDGRSNRTSNQPLFYSTHVQLCHLTSVIFIGLCVQTNTTYVHWNGRSPRILKNLAILFVSWLHFAFLFTQPYLVRASQSPNRFTKRQHKKLGIASLILFLIPTSIVLFIFFTYPNFLSIFFDFPLLWESFMVIFCLELVIRILFIYLKYLIVMWDAFHTLDTLRLAVTLSQNSTKIVTNNVYTSHPNSTRTTFHRFERSTIAVYGSQFIDFVLARIIPFRLRRQYSVADATELINSILIWVDFFLALLLLMNGCKLLYFTVGSSLKLVAVSLHAYFNVWYLFCDLIDIVQRYMTAKERVSQMKKVKNKSELVELYGRDENEVCAVCYMPLFDDEISNDLHDVFATTCHHIFHMVCIRKWVMTHGVCPMCHQNI